MNVSKKTSSVKNRTKPCFNFSKKSKNIECSPSKESLITKEIDKTNKFVSCEESQNENNNEKFNNSNFDETAKDSDYLTKHKKASNFLIKLWKKLDILEKVLVISCFISLMMLFFALFFLKVFPIVFSIIQIVCLSVAYFLHKKIIQTNLAWIKYLLIVIAIVSSTLNITSYFWNHHKSNNPSQIVLTLQNASTPYNSNNCKGKDYFSVKSDFQAAGFENINNEIIKDLDIIDSDKYQMVDSVSINGIDVFDGNVEFNTNSLVIIKYHSYKEVNLPFSISDIPYLDTNTLIKELNNVGFQNITTEEKIDLNPDETDSDFINELIINDNELINQNEMYPVNSSVKIVTHKPYKNYSLEINIDFVPNFIFSTYDVKLEINGEIKKLKHGENAKFSFRLPADNYKLTFSNVNSSQVKGEKNILVKKDTKIDYRIYCYSDKIDVIELSKTEIPVSTTSSVTTNTISSMQTTIPISQPTTSPPVTLNPNLIKTPISSSFTGEYTEAVTELKKAGFTNVKTNVTYDLGSSIFSTAIAKRVVKITINGSDNFEKDDAFDKSSPCVVYYRDLKYNDPNIEYTQVTVSQMLKDLEENGLNAENKYYNKYYAVTGYIYAINDSGEILLEPSPNSLSFQNVSCTPKTNEQEEKIVKLKKGQKVTIYGKIIFVDSFTGYAMDIYRL